MQKNAAPGEFETVAVRVSNVSVAGNTLLTVYKLLSGVIARSGAMVSDAVHSASDVLSSFIVILGVRMAGRDSDAEHPYGHEKFEPAAAVVLAVILCFTGLFIGHTAIEKLSGKNGEMPGVPGLPALIAAAVSIAAKEAMYRYTRAAARRIDSTALMAEAQHHRSDALSSVGSLVGIYGARRGFPWLDPAASLAICCCIEKAAWDIFRDAMEKLVDHACSEELQNSLTRFAEEREGVLSVRELRSREFGSRVYVDMEVCADGSLTLREGEHLAEELHDAMETAFPKLKHISVRVVPIEQPGGDEADCGRKDSFSSCACRTADHLL